MNQKGFAKPKEYVPANLNNVLWCPFCTWHMPDNYTNRRRYGLHIVNKHYEDVAYPIGTEPPPIEEL
jgi:hypothetical protein